MTSTLLMAVGSLNRPAPYFETAHGVGLSLYRFDPETGAAEWLAEDRGIDNPTYLSIDPLRRCIYAGTEVFGWHEGTVSAYRIEEDGRRLRYLNKQPTLGSITAHSSFDRTGRVLLVANYGMGPAEDLPGRAVALYRLKEDGSLPPPEASIVTTGTLGPEPDRQERPHPHCVLPSPDNRFVVVADLGLDMLLTFPFDPDGSIAAEPSARLALAPGSGPRHLVFHPNGSLALVINELDSTIASLRFHPEDGRFDLLDTAPALPAGAPASHCADIQLHPNGRVVYGSNRGHDSITILALDPDTGALTPRGHQPCGGRTPRNLAIDPTGRFLLSANQNGGTVAVFSINPETGALTPSGRDIAIGSPMCVKFLLADRAG